MNANVEAEVARRRLRGLEPKTVAGIRAALAEIGYKMDRSCDARGVTRYLSGEFAGATYPATTVYIVEADTGVSFANYREARRDENFRRLQEMRRSGGLYAVVGDRILET